MGIRILSNYERSWLQPIAFLLLLYLWMSWPASAQAARIGDLTELDWKEQAVRFLSLRDTTVRNAALGAVFMGISCGLFGGYVVARRMSLFGDTLSHAVLPGVALGFLWSHTKDPLVILVGATIAGLLGTMVVAWIGKTTRVKEDSALGLVLSGFYALGICLLTVIQKMDFGNQSGIDKFLFGQAAAWTAPTMQPRAAAPLRAGRCRCRADFGRPRGPRGAFQGRLRGEPVVFSGAP